MMLEVARFVLQVNKAWSIIGMLWRFKYNECFICDHIMPPTLSK